MLNSVENTSYVLGSELWKQNLSLLCLVKEFIVGVKEKNGDDSCPNQLQSQSSLASLGGSAEVEGQRVGKF